jgi:hypothetical protein
MRKLAVVLLAVGGLLSACVAWVPDTDGRHYGDRSRDGTSDRVYRRDRDGDGVPDRQDRRPDDPRRY